MCPRQEQHRRPHGREGMGTGERGSAPGRSSFHLLSKVEGHILLQETAVAGTTRHQPHHRGCDRKPGKGKLQVLHFGYITLGNTSTPNSGLEVGQHSLNLWIQPPRGSFASPVAATC